MFQAPAAAPAVNRAPARPVWRLNGRQVTQDMFYAVQNAKKDGRRCFLDLLTLHDDEMDARPDECQNCLGAGYFILDVAMVGPLKEMPANTGTKGEDAQPVHLRPAWHNKAWWLVVREPFPCPLCNNRREVIL